MNKMKNNKMKNRLSRAWFLLLFVILLSSSVSGLAITPGRTTLDFEAGLHKEIKVRIINNKGQDVDLLLGGRGKLKEYISVRESSISLGAGESKEVTYEVDLPQEMDYGLNKGGLVVIEVPGEGKINEGEGERSYVDAALAVVSQLYVEVPYPGRYAEAELSVKSKGGEATFFIPVESKGQFDLKDVRANVDIYTLEGEEVDSFVSGSIDVPSGERKEIIEEWKTNVTPGKYEARVNLIYGQEAGKTIRMNETFTLGEKGLQLQNIEVNDFTLGEIAKMEMLVRNRWNREAREAYIEAKVYKEGDLMSQFKSASQDIGARSKKVLTAYWDTEGVRKGTYDTELYLKHEEESIKEDIKLEVEENDIKAVGIGYVISEKKGEEDGSLMTILITVVVVLVLVNVAWFIFIRRKLKG